MLLNNREWLGFNHRWLLPFSRIRARAGRDFRYATAGKARRLARDYIYRQDWAAQVAQMVDRADDDALGTFLVGSAVLSGEGVLPGHGLVLGRAELNQEVLRERERVRRRLNWSRNQMVVCSAVASAIWFIALMLVSPVILPVIGWAYLSCACSIAASGAFAMFCRWWMRPQDAADDSARACALPVAGGCGVGLFTLFFPVTVMLALFLAWRAMVEVADELDLCRSSAGLDPGTGVRM